MQPASSSSLARQVRRAIDQDGLFELSIGCSFLGTPLLVLSGVPYLSGLFTVLILTVLLPFARNSITYPRIGYVKPRETAFPVVLLFVLGFAAVSLGVMALVLLARGSIQSRPAWNQMMPFGLGLFVGGFHLLWGILNGSRRHYLLSALSVAGGVLSVLFSGGDMGAGAGIYFLGFGTLQLIIGIVMLARFLARHPRPQEARDDA